jgi:hypothetical protein
MASERKREVFVSAIVAFIVSGCGSEADGCVAGASAKCSCSNGDVGAQTCNADGTFDACLCDGEAPADEQTEASDTDEDGSPATGEDYSESRDADENDPTEALEDEADSGDADEDDASEVGEDEAESGDAEEPTEAVIEPADTIDVDEDPVVDFNPRVDCLLFPANLGQDTTIARGCYRVAATPSFALFTTLTLSPGVTLYVESGVWLEVPENGVLQAYGVQSDPIVIRGIEEEAGFWGGVRVIGDAMLSYVTIRDAGGLIPSAPGAPPAGLSVDGGLSLSDCVLTGNAGYGLRDESVVAPALFENNVVTGNERSVLVNVWQVDALGRTSTFSGNAQDTLDISLTVSTPNLPITLPMTQEPGYIGVLDEVERGLDGSRAWPRLDVPYRPLEGLGIAGTLALSPGVQMRFPAGTGVRVSGTFVAQGTVDSPVVLQADQPGNDWYGIVSCGNGVADLTQVEIAGASENAAFVSGACEYWETGWVPEVHPGIHVAP